MIKRFTGNDTKTKFNELLKMLEVSDNTEAKAAFLKEFIDVIEKRLQNCVYLPKLTFIFPDEFKRESNNTLIKTIKNFDISDRDKKLLMLLFTFKSKEDIYIDNKQIKAWDPQYIDQITTMVKTRKGDTHDVAEVIDEAINNKPDKILFGDLISESTYGDIDEAKEFINFFIKIKRKI